MPEQHRHRLHVLAVSQVDRRERVAQRVGADPLEADLPHPSAPVVPERVVAPRRARAPEDGRRVLQDEPGLRQQPALLLDPLADDRGGVAVQRDRPHGAVGLGVALDPPVPQRGNDAHLCVVIASAAVREAAHAQREHLLGAHAGREQEQDGDLHHAEGQYRRLVQEALRLVLHQRVDQGPVLLERLRQEALLGDVAGDVLAVERLVEDLAHELEHLVLHRRPRNAYGREGALVAAVALAHEPGPVLLESPLPLVRPLLREPRHREHALLDVLGGELLEGDFPDRRLDVLQVAPFVVAGRLRDAAHAPLDVARRVLAEGHRRPGGGAQRPRVAVRLEGELELGVLLVLERLGLPLEVDLLVEREDHAGELLLAAEVAPGSLGDADRELVGGGPRVLALAPLGASPCGGLVEVVRLVALEGLHAGLFPSEGRLGRGASGFGLRAAGFAAAFSRAALARVEVLEERDLRDEPPRPHAAAPQLPAAEHPAHLLAARPGELRDVLGRHHVGVVAQHEQVEPVGVRRSQPLLVNPEIALQVFHRRSFLARCAPPAPPPGHDGLAGRAGQPCAGGAPHA